jgi:hypothetical protein
MQLKRLPILILSLILLIGVVGVGSLAGCESKAQTGALIGAGAGAASGYIIGNEMDKSEHHHGRHH